MRGFAAALALASLLASAALALGDAAVAAERAASVFLAAAVCWMGWGVVSGRAPRRFLFVVVLATALLGLLVFHLREGIPSTARAVHVAAVLAYGATAAAAILTALRLGEGKALMLTFSSAVALFGADILVTPPEPLQAAEWNVSMIPDAQVGHRYAANSTAKMFYPDNPRGYFLESNSRQDAWSLETHGGSEAQLEHLPSDDDAMRVTIRKLAGPEVFNVKLTLGPLPITKGAKYILRFRAKASAARAMYCAAGIGRAPWDTVGAYAQVDLQQEPKDFECPFAATASDARARVFFDLGGSDATVELSHVVLYNESTATAVEPAGSPKRFFVGYRFNSLGFRGTDPVVPRPPGTYRILALGDSYAAGIGVHEHDTFEVLLQERLNRHAPKRDSATSYEVINAGVAGYATRQELRSYELFASTYEPQVVLLIMVFNDDISFEEEVRRGYFATPSSGESSGLTSLWQRAQPPRPYDYADSIRALQELNEACKQRGAKLAVVLFQNVRAFEPWDRLAADVKAGLEGSGVPILNLRDALLKDVPDPTTLWVHPIDGHPNEVAHGIAAKEIEQFLRTERLLPQ